MRDILEKITPWWEAGETFGLATVTNTYRSAPRDPGAALAVSADGEVIGSVSGGCVEGAVYQLSTDVAESGTPVLETYGVSDDDAFAVGLTCGGIIDIFVEPVNKDSFPELGEILAAVRRGEPVAVATVISGPGQIGARRVIWARTDSEAAQDADDSHGEWHAGSSGTLGADMLDEAIDVDARGMLDAGPDRHPPVRRGRRAHGRRAQRVRQLVRPAAADAGLRRDRLRRRRRAGREIPRLPRHAVRRPADLRDQVAVPRRGRGGGRVAAPVPRRGPPWTPGP